MQEGFKNDANAKERMQNNLSLSFNYYLLPKFLNHPDLACNLPQYKEQLSSIDIRLVAKADYYGGNEFSDWRDQAIQRKFDFCRGNLCDTKECATAKLNYKNVKGFYALVQQVCADAKKEKEQKEAAEKEQLLRTEAQKQAAESAARPFYKKWF